VDGGLLGAADDEAARAVELGLVADVVAFARAGADLMKTFRQKFTAKAYGMFVKIAFVAFWS
jgi:hypothetical protein